MTSWFRSEGRWIALVLFCATFALYAPSLGNDFTNWDDPQYVAESPFATRGLAGIPAAWTTGWEDAWYPLTHTVHCIVSAVAGPSPLAHHLVQRLIAALAVALIPAALAGFGVGARMGAVIAVLWMAHPMRVESFVWAANLKDTLSLLLVLAAFAGWHAGRRRLSALAFTGALLAKTTVFPLALLFVWLEAGELRLPALRRALRRTAGFWVPALVCAAIAAQLHVIGAGPNVRSVPGGTLLAAVPSALWLPWWYLGRTLSFTWPQTVYAFEPVGWGDGRFFLALASWALVIGAALALRNLNRQVSIAALLGFSLPFLPVTGLVPLYQPVADRYALLPSLVLVAVGVAGVAWVARRLALDARFAGAGAAMVTVALLAVSLPTTVVRQQQWRDSITLWEADRERVPQHPVVRRNLAAAYGGAGRWADVIAEMDAVRDLRLDWPKYERDYFFAQAAHAGMRPELVLEISAMIDERDGSHDVLRAAARRASLAGHRDVAAAVLKLVRPDAAP